MRERASLDMIADPGASGVLAEAAPAPEPQPGTNIDIETTRQAREVEDSRSTSSTSSPAPADNEESDFFLGANDSQSSLGVPNLQDMQVNDVECLSPVHRLPNEILIAIFAKLSSTADILHVMMTCQRWARNAVDILWHRPSCSNWDKHIMVCRTLGVEHPYFFYRDFVRRLNLALLADLINDGSVMPFASCTRIERLTLTGCVNLTDSGLIALVNDNSHLYSLDISRDAQITEASIYAIAANCPRLQGLNVSECTRISNESMIQLAQRCRFIKRLKLNKCAQLTDDAVLAFAEHCPNILEIDLEECRLVGNESVTAIFTKARALRELRLVSCELVDDSAFLALPSNRTYDHLRILDLSSCQRLTDRAVEKIIAVAPRLRNIVLQKCRNLTDAAVYALSSLGKNLHYLHLGHCGNITDDAVKRLVASCNRLRYIDLGCCTNLTDDSVAKLATLPKLKRIGLVKCASITDNSIIALANANRRARMRKDAYGNLVHGEYSSSHSSLERVHLSYCINLTLKSIMRLLNCCPRLTHLSLTGVQAFLRQDLEQFSRDAPEGFTDHQRSVFCVFSGEGVLGLRKHLNGIERESQGMHLSMRGGPPAGAPIFPAVVNPPPPHMQSADDGFDEVDAVDDDDGLEDGSEMVIDTQPLLHNHNTGLGVPPTALGTIPVPPPIPPTASHAHPVNPNPFGYVAGHPPYIPQQLPWNNGPVGFVQPTSPPPGVPGGQDGAGDGVGSSLATLASTVGAAGSDPAFHEPAVPLTTEAGPSTASLHNTGPIETMANVPTEQGQNGSPGPADADQPPGSASPGGA